MEGLAQIAPCSRPKQGPKPAPNSSRYNYVKVSLGAGAAPVPSIEEALMAAEENSGVGRVSLADQNETPVILPSTNTFGVLDPSNKAAKLVMMHQGATPQHVENELRHQICVSKANPYSYAADLLLTLFATGSRFATAIGPTSLQLQQSLHASLQNLCASNPFKKMPVPLSAVKNLFKFLMKASGPGDCVMLASDWEKVFQVKQKLEENSEEAAELKGGRFQDQGEDPHCNMMSEN
jgi:hypothetical protein